MNLDDLSRIKDSLFLPKLYFIELEKGLPGGLLPDQEESDIIKFNNRPVTPLIPLNSVLLDYLTPEDLVKQIKFKMQNSEQVCLILDLPLTGVEPKQKSYRLYKDYDLKEENCLGEQFPLLQLWPNFRADKWQDYYLFYYDLELEGNAFNVSVPNPKDSYDFKLGFGKYAIIRLENFPTHIDCVDSQGKPTGMILLKSPNIIHPHKKCKIGVDFNTKFTNIYIQHNNNYPEPLKLKNLQLQITASKQDTRINTLFEHFIPENFIPRDKSQIYSILTTEGARNNNPKLPIIDGRMYIPNFSSQREEAYIKTNLSWTSGNREDVELFLKHLALHISALVVEQEIGEIELYISYPLTFEKKAAREYVELWQKIIEELEPKTGIKLNFLNYKDMYNYQDKEENKTLQKDMIEIIKRLASSNQTIIIKQETAMNHSSDNSQNLTAGRDVTLTNSTANVREISGNLSNLIQQLPDNLENEKNSIKELLNQLIIAIETEEKIDSDNKAEALEEVKNIVDAANNIEDGNLKKLAKRSKNALVGIVSTLPNATKLIEEFNRLLPAITQLLGL